MLTAIIWLFHPGSGLTLPLTDDDGDNHQCRHSQRDPAKPIALTQFSLIRQGSRMLLPIYAARACAVQVAIGLAQDNTADSAPSLYGKGMGEVLRNKAT